eukprot:scaffold13155_cov138-Isochrysis_galbana.AAC.2
MASGIGVSRLPTRNGARSGNCGGAGRVGQHVEDEALPRVRHHQRLGATLEGARAIEAVLLCKSAHQGDGLASRAGTFHCNLSERVDGEQRLPAVSGSFGAKDPRARRLPNTYLHLVESAVGLFVVRIGVHDFGNVSNWLKRGLTGNSATVC